MFGTNTRFCHNVCHEAREVENLRVQGVYVGLQGLGPFWVST